MTRPRGEPQRGVDVTWNGHATVSMHVDGTHLLTDPVFGNWIGPIRRRRGSIDAAALSPADAVLISHLHHDHLDLPSLRRLGSETPIIVPPGGGTFLERRGFRRVEELPVGRELRAGAVTVTAIPAAHIGNRLFGPNADSVGYLVAGSRSVYFAGDTARFDGMRALAGAVDLALLPVGGWGPTLGREGHMDWRDAARALVDIRPASVVPIHWGTFWPVGLGWLRPELFHRPGPRFATEAGRAAPGVDVHLLPPGARLIPSSQPALDDLGS